MRLGTLARKISVTPSAMTAFLESEGIDLTSGTNTKLTDEQIELVLQKFKKTLDEEVPEEEIKIAPVPVVEITPEVVIEEEPIIEEIPEAAIRLEPKEIEPKEETEEAEEEPKTSGISDSFAEIALPHELGEEVEVVNPVAELTTETDNKTDEVIVEKEIVEEEELEEDYVPQIPADIDPDIESYVERAAYDKSIKVIKPVKVKLPGLKVKGKIDLPEPKVAVVEPEEPKKEEKKAYNPDEIITTTGPKRDRKRKPKNYKGKKYDKGYNPVEAARKKKEWEEKKRKELEEKRKKKSKAKHYKQTVVPSAKNPVAPKKNKPTKKAIKKAAIQEQSTGNAFQRFWRWMNT